MKLDVAAGCCIGEVYCEDCPAHLTSACYSADRTLDLQTAVPPTFVLELQDPIDLRKEAEAIYAAFELSLCRDVAFEVRDGCNKVQ